MKYYIYVKGIKKYYSGTVAQSAKNLWVWRVDDVFIRKQGRCKSYEAAVEKMRITLKREITVVLYV